MSKFINSPSDIKNPFPSDWIDPADKAKKEYNLAYAKAAYELFLKDKSLVTVARRQDFMTNRLYAEGIQNNLKYKKWNSTKNETDQWESFVDLDYSPVSDIPKYRDIVLGLMEKRQYEITLTAIDPMSDDQRQAMKFDMWAKKTLNDILQKQQIMLEADQGEEEILPQTKEELEIFSEMGGIKLPTEVAMKAIIDLTFDINNWPEIAKKVREDLFDNGLAATREYIDKQGKHKIRYVDVVNLLAVNSRNQEFKDSNWAGEIIEMTLSDLVSEAGDSFTKDEYMEIAQNCVNRFGNPAIPMMGFVDTDSDQYRNYGFLGTYGSYKIQVLDITWFTIDEKYYQKRETKDGQTATFEEPYGFEIIEYDYSTEGEEENKIYFRTPKGARNKEKISKNVYYQGLNREKNGKKRVVEKQATQMVYGCKWIVDTNYVYDYGKTTDMPREKSNLSQTKLPYNIYRLTNKSYVERMMPFVDLYMRTWMKLQNAIAKAKPKGVLVEIGALENMTIGGKEFTPLKALAVYEATGNLIYKGTGAYGDYGGASRNRPVEEMQGGMGAEFSEYMGAMNYAVQQIREVTGFNEAFDASTPDPKASVRGSQMALNATNNALQPLMSAFENIHVRTAKSSALRLQILSKYNKLKGYEYAISSTKRKIIEFNEDCSMVELGIKIDSRPSDEQKAKIEAAAIQAMNTRDAQGNPQIFYTDYLFVMRILDGGNLKMAEAVLAHRIQKRIEQQQMIAQQNSEMNAQIQERSIQSKSVADKEALDMAAQMKLNEINTQADAQIRIDNNKLEKQKEMEYIKVQGKVTASTNKDQADITKKVLESNTAIQKEHIKANINKQS